MHCEQADGVLFFSNMQACPELLHPLQVVRRIARLLHIGVVDVRSMVNGEGFHMRSPFSPSMPNLPRSKGQDHGQSLENIRIYQSTDNACISTSSEILRL